MGTGDKLTSNLSPYLNYYSVKFTPFYYLIDQNAKMPTSGRPCPFPDDNAHFLLNARAYRSCTVAFQGEAVTPPG